MASLTMSAPATPAIDRLRRTFDSGVTKPLAWRRRALRNLRRMILDNERVLEECLRVDLGKPIVEAQVTEIGFVLAEIDHTLSHVRRWVAPRRVRVPVALMPARARIVAEPRGVVLIIAPWNYPIHLSLAPMVGALAAGNVVVLKPSEIAPASAEVLARLLPEYLGDDVVAVVQGGPEETGALLEHQWDHIFYTGNERVARIVAEAAAKHLTPLTLELGGKSPTFVDSSTNILAAARRIAWGKFVNAGQTCVAPDYVLVTREARASLEGALSQVVREMFGADPSASPDFARIVNSAHFARLTALLDSSLHGAGTGSRPTTPPTRIVAGEADAARLYFPPTVVSGESLDSLLMQEEIFGPILPLIEVEDHREAIEIVRARPNPLALYVFSESADVQRDFTQNTRSGALCFNVPLAHMGVHGLPFGGVGSSGYGAYHGKLSFDIFSHDKAILWKPLAPETLRVIAPPYSSQKASIATGALRKLS